MAEQYDADEQRSKETPLALGRIPADTPENITALTGVFTRWHRELEEVKWPRGLQHFENASFLLGNHTTRFYFNSDSGFGFHNFGLGQQSSIDSLVAKVADNKLIRPVETVVSMLTDDLPEPRVEPNSDRPEDEDAADLGGIVIKLFFEKPLDMPTKLQEVALTACITGTAAVEVQYGETDIPEVVPKWGRKKRPNPFAGQEDPTTGQPEPDKIEVDEIVGEETVMRRDLMANVWTPFHIIVDPMATKPENMRWIFRSTFEDIDDIKEKFVGEREDGFLFDDEEGLCEAIQEESSTRFILYWYAKFQDILESPQYYSQGTGFAPQTFSTHSGYAPNQTMFTVADIKPTVQFPSGRTLIFAGGTLLWEGDARAWSEKYPLRWHPYSFFSWFEIPGRFWGIPLLSEIVPLQKKINAIDAQTHANRQYMAIGQWMLPKHSKVQEGRISGIPGDHINYTAAPGLAGPERVPHVPLPAELLVEREQLVESIDHIAASGLTSSKVSPSAARAGVILDAQRAERLESKSPMFQRYQAFLEGIAQNVLIEIQLNMTEEDPQLTARIRAAAREFSGASIQSFTASSLRDHHAVVIDVASSRRHSPEALADMAMQYLQYKAGQLSPEENNGVLRAIRLDKFVKDAENASTQRARRMVARIKTGVEVAAFPMPGIDVASAMAPVFQNELLRDGYHELEGPVKDQLLQLFDYYSKAAAEEAQRAMEQQIAMMQMEKGGPPAPSE